MQPETTKEILVEELQEFRTRLLGLFDAMRTITYEARSSIKNKEATPESIDAYLAALQDQINAGEGGVRSQRQPSGVVPTIHLIPKSKLTPMFRHPMDTVNNPERYAGPAPSDSAGSALATLRVGALTTGGATNGSSSAPIDPPVIEPGSLLSQAEAQQAAEIDRGVPQDEEATPNPDPGSAEAAPDQSSIREEDPREAGDPSEPLSM